MIYKILILIILILINGIASATEIAFLSLNKYELYKELKKDNKKAKKILNLLNDTSSFLSTIQIVITFSGFLASAFAAENFASEISSFINIPFLSEASEITVLIIIITIILSYFTLVFGELIPKKIGLAYSKQLAFTMINPLNIVLLIFKPLIIILKGSINFFAKLLHIKEPSVLEEEGLKNSIFDAELEDFEKNLLFNVFEFNDKLVKEAMTKKDSVITIKSTATAEQLLETIRQYKFTRFPIVENNTIIGVVNVKDLIILKKDPNFNLKKYLRKLPKIKSTMIIDDAFLYLLSKKEVMAEVVEEGKFIGIVTIEDLIEEVIGSIGDEYN